jgi:hypothetical protein
MKNQPYNAPLERTIGANILVKEKARGVTARRSTACSTDVKGGAMERGCHWLPFVEIRGMRGLQCEVSPCS